MNLAQSAIKYWDVTVTATLANGSPATLTGVNMAIVPPGASPNHATPWLAASYSNGVASILVAGPEYQNPPGNALVVPPVGGDLWAQVVDNPETDAKLVDCNRLI